MGLLQPHGRHRRGNGQADLGTHPPLEGGSKFESECEQISGRGHSLVLDPSPSMRCRYGLFRNSTLPQGEGQRSPVSKFRTLDDLDVKAKRVLVRADLNV